jgi:hypothetical protein
MKNPNAVHFLKIKSTKLFNYPSNIYLIIKIKISVQIAKHEMFPLATVSLLNFLIIKQ